MVLGTLVVVARGLPLQLLTGHSGMAIQILLTFFLSDEQKLSRYLKFSRPLVYLSNSAAASFKTQSNRLAHGMWKDRSHLTTT